MRKRKKKFEEPLSSSKTGGCAHPLDRAMDSRCISHRYWPKYRRLYLSPHLGIQARDWSHFPSLPIDSGMGKRVLGTPRLYHADVSHHDDWIHPGLFPSCSKLMNWISGWSNPEKPWQAIVVMSLFSMIIAWFNWGTSLIASAMLALFIVRETQKSIIVSSLLPPI